MNLSLSNLLLCCRELESDRATERKKAAENFRRLLRSQEVVQELDRTSGSKPEGSKQLTWNAVFRFLQRYVQRETESMQSSKSKVTASTLTTRQKKMAEMCSLIKDFIRCANKRGPRLKCSELLKHVTEVLQSSHSCAAYGEDYSSLLVKDILSVRKYWCDITPQQWHNLLDLYCGLFISPSKSVNLVLVSRVIRTLVHGCCAQTEGFHNTLFRFFPQVLLARQEKHLIVLEHLISALNIFGRFVALNYRMRLCHLGEELTPALLRIWADTRPSLALKEAMVEFFSLQICAHHPKGARTQDAGAYAADWSRWRSLLLSLYDALIGEIGQISSRGKYVTGSRHVAVKDGLIELTAHICHQLFSDSYDGPGPVMTPGAPRASPMGGTPSKRRRLDLGWELLRERLQPQQSDFDLIPWLQITAVLTSRHPAMLPGPELLPLLAALHQLLAEQKRGERGPYVLRCLKEVAQCQTGYPDKAQGHRSELSRLWARVCALALRGVSAPQTEALSLDLLRAVVRGGLISVDRELWKLLSGSACKPSLAAALCLAQALLECPLPTSVAPASDCRHVGLMDGSSSPHLKETLLAWLLMTDQSDEMDESSRPHPIICRDFPPHLISNILVSLTMKDTRAGLRFLLGSEEVESCFHQEQLPPDGTSKLAELERLYLQFSLNTLPAAVGGGGGPGPEVLGSPGGQFAAAPGLRSKLEESLLFVAENLRSCYVPESPSSPPECLVRCVALLTGVLAASTSAGIMSEEEACRSAIFLKAKVLLQELSGFVLAAKAKLAKSGSASSLSSVIRLCTQSSSRSREDRVSLVSSRLWLMLLPSSLLRELADISKLLSSSLSGRLHVLEDNDGMEEDWDVSRAPQSEEVDLFDEGSGLHTASSGSSGSSGQKTDHGNSVCGPGAKSPLSEDLLSQQDLALLAVLDFLCVCASVQPDPALPFKPQEVQRRLLQLLQQVDFSRPLHLSMYLVLLKKLPAEDCLAPEEFDSLLRPLADLSSDYRQDQEVCAAVLLALLPSIRSLGGCRHPPEDMRHVRGLLLKVVSGFCHLSQTGKCVAAVRVALVGCLVALLEADPRCDLAILEVPGDEENETPVSAIFSSHLGDAHHQVRMLVATSVERLFLEVRPGGPDRRKMLPLKQQLEAFEDVYLKAQQGMRFLRDCCSDDQQDESSNRKAALLRSLCVMLCCSPVCEKQALFALFQSYKENNIEEQLIKKILGSVCRELGYSSVRTLVSSHLDYLVAEWLAQRQSDERYTLGSFPFTVLDQETVTDFYSSSYQVLVPHLVLLDDFEQVKSIGRRLQKDWKELLADCFPKILVNILPYFVLRGQDPLVAQQQEKANRVYELLKDSSYLGKQQIDSLIHSNLAEIVVELLMTLYEGSGADGELRRFVGELDPAPNPPNFTSCVIRATLGYLSKCHSATHRSLVAILSKTPVSIQRILLSVCERAAETSNRYERHRVLLAYHLFVQLLLEEVKDGLGGAWAFVLRDVIYTLIHHLNSSQLHSDEVSDRSVSLCCHLLASVCSATLQFCKDALDCHLQVIVGTLMAQVTSRPPPISQQMLSLLHFLIIEKQQELKEVISRLEPFPDLPEFTELRSVQNQLKYNTGSFTLSQEVVHFLSVTSCDSVLLTRLEGLKQLSRQLHDNRGQIRELLGESHADGVHSVLVKLLLSLLQLSKLAVHQPGGGDILEAVGSCLGELGPVELSTIALLHGRDPVYERAAGLFPSTELQQLYVALRCMDDALTQPSTEVRAAAAVCVKNLLAAQSGLDFWEQHRLSRDPLLAYLNPFRNAKKKDEAGSPEDSSEARDKLENQSLWNAQAGSHRSWLKTLCTALLDSGGVRSEALLLSRPLCLVWTDCCQRLLPLIVHSILQHDSDGSWRRSLSSHFQEFFSFCCRRTQASSRSTTPLHCHSGSEGSSPGLHDQNSLRTMLAVLDYLRHQQRPASSDRSGGTVCDSNFWLELNYLEVAKAAQSCSAHFTALLYTEIYVDKLKAGLEDTHRATSRATRRLTFEDGSQTSISSLDKRSVEDAQISLQELLFEVYRSIGEPDSLYGCGGETMTSPLTRIRTYEHEALWGKALTCYDLHASLPEATRHVGMVEGLQNFGLSSIISTYMRGLEGEGVEFGAELRELRFQAAWRSSQWDCELSERSQPGFHESVFCSVRALRDRELGVFEQTVKQARVALVEDLCGGSLEAVSSLYPALRDLQSIRQLENIRPLFSRPGPGVCLEDVCSRWRRQSQLLQDSDFTLVEPIMAVRSVALHSLMSRAGDPDSTQHVGSVLTEHLMDLCRLARKAGNTQLAEHAVFQMKQLASAGSCVLTPVSSWQLEEAQVFWAKGEQELALGLLRQMIRNLEELVELNPAVVPVYTESLQLCGNWLAETCLESPGVILENYLERAVEVIQKDPGCRGDPGLLRQRTEAFLSLARFSDLQYQTINKYMKSSEFENKQALLTKAKEEVGVIREHGFKNRYTAKVQKEMELDEKALANLRADRQRFLCKAVENYVQCLEQGEEHDTWVFRLASLWLENGGVAAVNATMKKGVKKIPSHKFLPLMYQLAARMGTQMASEDSGFQDVLHSLMCGACVEHPHHTLFIILALVNANRDKAFCNTPVSKGVPWQPSPLDLERSDRAQKVLSLVQKKRSQLVAGMERLCEAYITLAYMDATKHKTEKRAIPIPADQPIMKIRDLNQVVIPTLELKVDPSGCYDNLVTVRSFQPHYRLVGGVNVPKIIDCVGSDGRSRKQLVKAKDDLRQDAVMQQVFSMCSMLLQRNTDTRKRKLNIRRYKVVPFSRQSGVLEWCSGTVPIGQFLVDPDQGAHRRFRPQDWSNLNCRKRMTAATDFQEKLLAYNEVCRNFRPVFRFFCMERFLDPAVWMEKRLSYTRSVATSSIVGYMVGLGDRHIQNILIDEQTAELVHIDLGVAFEQGKTLPTPETVPFRLSRDIVDGMGITGVEGVFRRCCEKTLEVMRSSQEALLTIVEVLLYDPLFDWTMNPLKAFHLQRDEQQELNATLGSTLGGENPDSPRRLSDRQNLNKVAERVLLRLQEKLKGVEDGAVLSVRGQVNLLIQQALDPRNLSRLFPGWQAWV